MAGLQESIRSRNTRQILPLQNIVQITSISSVSCIGEAKRIIDISVFINALVMVDAVGARSNFRSMWQMQTIVHRYALWIDDEARHGTCLEDGDAHRFTNSTVDFDELRDGVLVPFAIIGGDDF